MLNLKLRLDIVFCTHAGYKNYYIIRYNMRAAAILGHEPAIDPATHLGGEGRQGALYSPGAHLP